MADKLTWNTEDKDIYYQGTNNQRSSGFHGTEILPGRCTDKSKMILPVKSGHLKIEVTYKNNVKNKTKVGKKTD